MLISLPFFKPTPESLVKKLQDLPPAPKILQTLQKLVADPETTIEKIAGVIKLEPGLSARVVRMANSTQFGGRTPVETIMEAIQRVGLEGVQELVTFAVASQLIGRPLVAYEMSAQNLWLRAIACALASSALAERCEIDRTEAYTAGLMHGIGLMAIDRHVAQTKARRVFASSGYPVDFAPAERDWLGFSHAEAGAALLDMWGFSENVTTAVRFQIEPEKASAHRQLCMILGVARWARSLFCVSDEAIPELPSAVWLQEAHVDLSDFHGWLKTLRTRYTIACEEMRLS